MSWWRVGVHQATCGWDLHLTLLLQPLQWLNPRRGSVQQQTSGGRVRRGPNCFDVSRPAVPGGARHTWGAAQPEDIHHPVGLQLFLHNHPLPPAFLRLKPGKFGNKTGAVPSPAVLISGDRINLCKLRPQLQLHKLHLKRQKTVGESFPRPTIYPLNRSIPSQRQPEHSCQDLNLTCEISILNSLA